MDNEDTIKRGIDNNVERIKIKRESVRIWLGVGLAVFGCILILIGVIIPPSGIVDGSILTATGEIFGLSGASMGIFAYNKRDNAKIDYMYRYVEERERNKEYNGEDDGTVVEEEV